MYTLICKTSIKDGKTVVILNQGNTIYISKPKAIENVRNPFNMDERYVGKHPLQFSEERRQHLKNQRAVKATWKSIFNTKGV